MSLEISALYRSAPPLSTYPPYISHEQYCLLSLYQIPTTTQFRLSTHSKNLPQPEPLFINNLFTQYLYC